MGGAMIAGRSEPRGDARGRRSAIRAGFADHALRGLRTRLRQPAESRGRVRGLRRSDLPDVRSRGARKPVRRAQVRRR